MRGVVTLSASYGAHGDRVGRALAERLQLPFVDRAIPTTAAARQLGLPEESLDEHPPSRWQRIAAGFANLGVPVGPIVLPADIPLTPEQFRSATDAQLQHVADTTGAVVLGRAGMVVLRQPARRAVRAPGRPGGSADCPGRGAEVSTRPARGKVSGKWTAPGRPTPGCFSMSARTTPGCIT